MKKEEKDLIKAAIGYIGYVLESQGLKDYAKYRGEQLVREYWNRKELK